MKDRIDNRIDRIGEEKTNNFGSLMRIIKYRNNKDIDVFFPEYGWTKEHTSYNCFIKGNIKTPYECRTFGKGCLGNGIYSLLNNKEVYKTWNGMLRRCYEPKYHVEKPTYKDCEVCDEWLNFQVFAKWYYTNFYQIPGELMSLDKDILCKGNKIYSPDTCIFVPKKINSLFVKRDNDRGDFPIGVFFDKSTKKYRAQCNMNEKRKSLGRYNTPEEAFEVYKQYKEQYIKEVAEEYKNVIPQKLYNAMINYEVEIDD